MILGYIIKTFSNLEQKNIHKLYQVLNTEIIIHLEFLVRFFSKYRRKSINVSFSIFLKVQKGFTYFFSSTIFLK